MKVREISSFGQILRGLMALNNRTQRFVARAAEMREPRLSKIISGQARPTKDELRRLIEAASASEKEFLLARFALLHAEHDLEVKDLDLLLERNEIHNPVLCVYKSHSAFGQPAARCDTCSLLSTTQASARTNSPHSTNRKEVAW